MLIQNLIRELKKEDLKRLVAVVREDWMNKTSFNYITKCEIFFYILAVNPNGSSVKFLVE